MRLIPSWAAVIFAPCSSNLGKTAAEFEMQLQFWEFQQTCPCLGQVAPNFLQMQRCTKTPTEEAAPKKTPKEEAAPKRESFTKSLQTSPCVLVSVQETNNFPISANSVTILKRNGYFSVPNLQLSFSIIHFPTQIMSRLLRCNGTWCSWQLSRKATASQFQSKSQS